MAGIYIHIPFCKQACLYCNFHFSTSLKYKRELIGYLQKEIRLRREESKEPIETIYFGGGTPSLLEIREINDILNTVYQNFSVVENPEITLEANPEDLTKEVLENIAKTRVNRLSIGVQSFYDKDLQFMNRSHSSQQALYSIKKSKELGFEKVSIDLIYGWQNINTDRWKENIQTAINLGVNHISSYALTVEEKTTLHYLIKKGKLKPLDDDIAYEHFMILVEILEHNGFLHYEISNFARPGYLSKHNTLYWLGKPYIGIGPSSHSFNGSDRFWNIANNIEYIKAIQVDKLPLTIEKLSLVDRYNEYIMLSLRTIFGISISKIERVFGNELKEYFLNQIDRYLKLGQIIEKKGVFTLPSNMKFQADGIASSLFYIS